MEKRIDILDKVMTLDQDAINSNQTYKDEYQSILHEMEQQSERSVNSLMNKVILKVNYILSKGSGGNRLIKFFSGAFWLILITIFIPFMNTFKKTSDKLIAFILFFTITVIVGWGFSLVPVIVSPMVNYIGIPLIQLIIVIIIAMKKKK